MKYAFVELKGTDGNTVYMEPRNYDRYADKEVFKKGVLGLCIYENIHIGCFPLMFTYDEIIEHNPDCKQIDYIPSNDICFNHNSYTFIAKCCFKCEN